MKTENLLAMLCQCPSRLSSTGFLLALWLIGTAPLRAEPDWKAVSTETPTPVTASDPKRATAPDDVQTAPPPLLPASLPIAAPALTANPPIIQAQMPAAAPTLPAAPGTADLERRLRELEARLETIEANPAPNGDTNPNGNSAGPATQQPTQGDGSNLPFTSGWDRLNGFFIQSPDRQNRVRITGQIQNDFRGYLDRGDREDDDAFTIRRARIGAEATLFQFHEFRFLTDFGTAPITPATGASTGTPQILDAYYNMHYWDEFQVEAGKFKQPFSYEQLIQDRWTPFMERSLIDQLTPQRDVGFMLWGQNLLGNRLDWYASVYNGEQNGNTDTNDDKDYAFRVVARPLRGFVPYMDDLQFGMAYTTGIEQDSMNGIVYKTPAGIPFFSFLNNVRSDGLRNRWSPEIAYFLGGFGFVGQWFHMEQNFATPNGKTNVLVPYDGYYMMATYLLTGETRTTYDSFVGIDPLQPFDPRHGHYGIGAWELTGRASRLQIGDDVFAKNAQLASPIGNSNGATEMTLGFNWYLNGFVRVQFNWEHSWFDRPVQLAAGRFYRYDDALMTRLQIQF